MLLEEGLTKSRVEKGAEQENYRNNERQTHDGKTEQLIWYGHLQRMSDDSKSWQGRLERKEEKKD